MNKEQQRIAIADACGWTECQLIKSYDGEQVPYGVAPNESPILKETPDYLNDLNAMHEAEKLLSNKEKEVYAVTLHDICGNVPFWFGIAHATAAQKAEAFLKACNLWEGNDKL